MIIKSSSRLNTSQTLTLKTYAALSLQILADPVEVGLQPVHVGMLTAVFVQDVVQIEVEDVGVEAADLHVVLEEEEKLGNMETFRKRSAQVCPVLKLPAYG